LKLTPRKGFIFIKEKYTRGNWLWTLSKVPKGGEEQLGFSSFK
jgi:hypothetical protein